MVLSMFCVLRLSEGSSGVQRQSDTRPINDCSAETLYVFRYHLCLLIAGGVILALNCEKAEIAWSEARHAD